MPQPQLTHTLACAIPGFEGVEIVFNLMATSEQTDNFIKRMGGDGSHAPVVVEVKGWPAEFGPDPWGATAPVVFRAWASRLGWGRAMREWLDDPNS
jgi:hypothetical protein